VQEPSSNEQQANTAGAAALEFTPRYRTYVLAVLFTGQAFNLADRQILAIVMDDVKQALEVSDTAMGLLGGFAFAAFHTLAGIPIARWADRGVRRSILALGILIWSSLTVASGLARNFVELALARIGVGVGEASATPCAHSLVSDYFPQERRATALAWLAMGSSFGVLIGNLVGGIVRDLAGWRAAFFTLGAPGVILALLLRFTVREPTRGQSEVGPVDDRQESLSTVLRFLLGMRSYRHLLLAAGIHYFAHYGAGMWVPAFLMRVHGLSGTEVGTGLAWALSLPSLIGTFTGGWLADRLGRRDVRWYFWLPAIGTIVSLPFWALFLLAENHWVAFACVAPYYFIAALWTAPLQATAQALVKPRMRGMSAQMVSLVIAVLGMGLGPFAIGVVSDALEPSYGPSAIRYSLLLLAGVNVWALVHNLLGARALREDLEAKLR